MRSRAVLGVVVAVVAVVAVAGPGFAAGDTVPATNGPTASAASNTTITVQPRPNGDARVRVSTRFVLDGPNDSTAFRGLSNEFEDGNAGVSVSTFRWAANGSSVVTGRSMNVTNVTRNATVVGTNANRTDIGRLTLGFTWTAFARTEGNRLVVGDVFNGTHGTWLSGLRANQTLRIESPPGYTITRSPTGITNGTVRFEGPATFAPGSPTVRFERRGGTRSTPRTTPGSGVFGFFASLPLAVVGAGGLVVVVGTVAVVAYTLSERGADEPAVGEATTTPDDDGARADETGTAETTVPLDDEELLSDEERVERLLAANGGRMKQASIVDDTGWSNAKVSQLLSAMDEANRINKLRIGRENLISLPEETEE